jgi:hypothetical protein
MAWEMCVGEPPFAGSSEPLALLFRHVHEPIAPAHSVNPDVNADLSRWIDGLLVKEPEQRIQSPAVAWETLEEILISTIGPRWRRSAALPDAAAARASRGSPETPAHVQSSILLNDELVDELASRRVTAVEPTVTVVARGDQVPGPEAVAQPSSQPPPAGRGRTRRAAVVAGCVLAVLIVAGAVLVLVSGGDTHKPAVRNTADMAQAVRRLGTILDFSAAGNHLSKSGDFSAAVQNRTEVASRLARFHPPQALRAAAATLTQVTQLSIQFNRQRRAGHSARKVDREANALRHRFLEQFNPFAQRYLGRIYQIGEF